MEKYFDIHPEFIFFGIRIFISLIIGLIVGIERTINNHYAGIKTLVFVSIGSCLFASLSFYLKDIYPGSDPTRIIGQIVTGIGFLGAGTIVYNNDKVKGLTSSAVIWTVCSLGVLVGSGLFLVPIATSILLVIIMSILKWIEKKLERFDKQKTKDNIDLK